MIGNKYYYVGVRKIEMPDPPVGSCTMVCLSCRDQMWGDTDTISFALRSQGTLCMDCVCEMTGLNPHEIVSGSIEATMQILEEAVSRRGLKA